MIVVVRGGGDLASGVALRLNRAGLRIVITELPQPLAVRRLVSFSEAVYTGNTTVEGVSGHRVEKAADRLKILQILASGNIPVVVDPKAKAARTLQPQVVVDARMTKQREKLLRTKAKLIIGLGPGFVVGENCHAVIETKRGHTLGRVIWKGEAEPDSHIPEAVGRYAGKRVLRAPADGVLVGRAEIGDQLEEGQLVAEVDGRAIEAPFDGVLRGLVRPGIVVRSGQKIGDVDPRGDTRLCRLVSDKALAVGGGVLEAILSRPELRPQLWEEIA